MIWRLQSLQEVPTFPLISIPDHQLTEAELKEKRKQKLNKAGYDARMRAKADRDAAKAREVHTALNNASPNAFANIRLQAEEARIDEESRLRDFASWAADKRKKQEVCSELLSIEKSG
jgi:actin-related protein 5